MPDSTIKPGTPRRITIVEVVPAGAWQTFKEAVYLDMARGIVLPPFGEWLRCRFPVRTAKVRRVISDRRAQC